MHLVRCLKHSSINAIASLTLPWLFHVKARLAIIVSDIDSTAISAERLARKDSSWEQLLDYPIQSRYLDSLCPACYRFEGATLFMHAKNTKQEFMDETGNLNTACDSWNA
jgi:hypothetical protein